MKRFLVLALAALAVTATVGADYADARRLGGGRSLGAQRQSVAPPASPSAPAASPGAAGAPGAATAPGGAASNPVMAPGAASRAAPGATGAAAAGPAAAAAGARTGMARWLGPVAGIAGLVGLAWLASSLGISEALMSLMLVLLVAVVAIALLRYFLMRRSGAASPYAGTGPRPAAYPAGAQRAEKSFEPVFGGARAPAAAATSVRYPPGFDPAPFLAQARTQFTRLQAAYDAGDRTLLADVMTPELYNEVARDLDDRRNEAPTEIVSLFAEIVDVSSEADQHWASVRFHGLLREDGASNPKPFDEMWNLVKPVDGSSGWLLAGIRQLDAAPAGNA